MKVSGVAVIMCLALSVAFGQNSNGLNMLNMNNGNWGLNSNMNNWNGMNSNMNNWNGLNNMNNMNNWNGLNMNNMNNWNGLNSNMNRNWNGMNMNMLNTNMRNINGGRDDPARMSAGIYDDATASFAKHYYVNAPPNPITVIPSGDGGSAHTYVTSPKDDVMIVATSADDPTEGHVVVVGGDSIGMLHKTDV